MVAASNKSGLIRRWFFRYGELLSSSQQLLGPTKEVDAHDRSAGAA
jgi:hypothetical protein